MCPLPLEERVSVSVLSVLQRERDFIRKQAGARKADEEDGDGSTAHKGEHPTAHDPATCATGTTTLTPGTAPGPAPDGPGTPKTPGTKTSNMVSGPGGAPEGGAAAWATRVAIAGSRPRSDEARERRISNVTARVVGFLGNLADRSERNGRNGVPRNSDSDIGTEASDRRSQ